MKAHIHWSTPHLQEMNEWKSVLCPCIMLWFLPPQVVLCKQDEIPENIPYTYPLVLFGNSSWARRKGWRVPVLEIRVMFSCGVSEWMNEWYTTYPVHNTRNTSSNNEVTQMQLTVWGELSHFVLHDFVRCEIHERSTRITKYGHTTTTQQIGQSTLFVKLFRDLRHGR